MADIIEARVFQKTDTLAKWMVNSLVLGSGEQAFVLSEVDGKPITFKIGDGTKTFSELPWPDYTVRGKVTPTTVFTGLPSGVYIPTTNGTYGAITVVLSDGYQVLFWDGSSLVKIIYSLPVPTVTDGSITTAKLFDRAVTVGKAAFFKPKKNLFNPSSPGVVMGSLVNYANGSTTVNASYNATDYIDISAYTDITLSYKTHFAWYDANRAYISGETSIGVANYTVSRPGSAKYIKSSVPTSRWATFQIEAGTQATAYESFRYRLVPDDGYLLDLSEYTTPVVDSLVSSSTTSALSAAQGKVLNDKIGAIGVVSPWAAYAGTNTANELLIKSAIKSVVLSGPGISPTKTYYLARMAYKVTASAGVNDIYFRIHDQDGVIVAFAQFNSSSADVGLKEYVFTYNGNTAKVLIDWTNIPVNFIYSTGNNTTMQFTPSVYVFKDLFVGAKVTGVSDGTAASDAVNYGQLQSSATATQLKQSKSVFKRVGGSLYVGCKFDADNDIIIRFSLAMINNLMTFSSVGLAANSTKVPLLTVDRATTTTLASTSSDNIGPVQIDGQFVGANHEIGGILTAKNNFFSFFADGYEILDGDTGFADTITVNVVNEIYNPNTLSSSVKDVNVIENVAYRVRGGCIDVIVKHEFPIYTNITTYYGMQSVGQTYQTNVYFSESAITEPTARVANVQSGARSTYNTVDKIVLSNADKSLCQMMLLDKNYGLGSALNTDYNVLAADSLAFTSATKTYFRLLSGLVMSAGSTHSWRGTYSWFRQPTVKSSNTLFTNVIRRGKDILASAIFKGSATETVQVPETCKIHDAVVVRTTNSTYANALVNNGGLDIISYAAGNITVKVS